MTEEQQEFDPNEWECSMCGRTGGPNLGCRVCKGNPRFFVRGRHYTMTEERAGLNPAEKARRYGEDGSVGPERLETDIVMPKRR